MKNILFIVGSLRAESLNKRLAHVVARQLPEGYEASFFDIATLPHYSSDLEGENTPASVTAFRSAIRAADGLYITAPEYNFAIPGVLKNAIDWASRPMIPLNAVVGKPFNAAVATMSPVNGIRALQDIKRIMTSIGGFSATSFDFVLTAAQTKFVGEGATEELEPVAMNLCHFSIDALVRAIETDAGAQPLAMWTKFANSVK
jgi:NAD(P)H-dependent FMN reductase